MMDIWLPLFFVATMGLALLIYVILDGYDLGIGILLPLAEEEEKDAMIAAIGPFWDANETWIVLGVGILLIAFPAAHGIILSSLYLPVTLMLMGLILRGIAFDFRVKAGAQHKDKWNFAFFAGSLLASVCQGWMLGAYITGMTHTWLSNLFSLLIALTLPALYIMLGSAWLLIKTEGELFNKAIAWAGRAIAPMALALLLLSIATPMVSPIIADKWFSFPRILVLAPIPLLCTLALFLIARALWQKPAILEQRHWLLFAALALICVLSAAGLAYSIFPDIVIGRMTIWEAASSSKSLLFTFWGAAVTLPMILVYTVYVYRVFQGKSSALTYESTPGELP
jgi:cytochrome d ubiquinol oxidase subunit II